MERVALTLIWICFLVRGFFYCSFMPLWEGYDEWAHLAYVARVSDGELLPDRNQPVSREVSVSLRIVPLPWALRSYPLPSVTGDVYWQLSREDRSARQAELRHLPAQWSSEPQSEGLRIYEALQPPLYYWLAALPYRLIRSAPLTDRVFVLRYLNVVLASLVVPLVFLVARRFLPTNAAFGATILVSVFPEFLIDVCRVANDPLAIVLYSSLTILCLGLAQPTAGRGRAICAGLTLGCGLLAKAYLLAAIPAVIVVYIWAIRQSPRKWDRAWQAVLTFGIAALLAGWWYVRNRLTTGTWSGLSEAVILRQYTSSQFLAGAWAVPWGRAVDSILLSHIWFGGWSSLTVRSWMYHALFIVAALGVVGVILKWAHRETHSGNLGFLSAIYLSFWVAQAYNVVLLYLSKGAATSMGWYLYAVVATEVVLLATGLRALVPKRARAFILPATTVVLAALDLYTVDAVSIPYYTGVIGHRASGALTAVHLAALRAVGGPELFRLLSTNKSAWLSPGVLFALWLLYLASTLCLIGYSLWLWRHTTQERLA